MTAKITKLFGDAAILDVGTGADTVCAGDDSRLTGDRDPTAHAPEHTDGTDDIQEATGSQKGLATAAQITKLGTIAENADVTDLSEHVIDDLSDVTAATPVAGDSLVFENGDWINKNVTNVLGAGVGMPLYLDDTVVVDDYGSLLKIPDTVTAEQTADVAVTSETGFIQGFFYNADLLRAAWNAGEWIFNIWGRVSSATGVSTVIAAMYKVPAEDGTVTTTGTGTSRTATISGSSGTPFVSGDANADQTLAGYLQTAGGTFQITGYASAIVATIATATEYTNETAVACTVHKYLFQAETGEINNTTATTTLHNVSTIQATVALDLTDKAALRLYGKTTSGSSITISITYNGTEHYTNFRAPIYPKHNDLDGLNLGDYQHATVAEQAAWDAKLDEVVEDTTPQFGGPVDCNDQPFNGSSYTQITDASLGTGTHTFNYASGDMQQLTATGDITIAFSNFVSGAVCGMIIDAINWGAHTLTWPVGVLFAGGAEPAWTTSGTDRAAVIKDKDNVYTISLQQTAIAAVA